MFQVSSVLVMKKASISYMMSLLSKDDIEDDIMRVESKEIAAELLEMTFCKGNHLTEYYLPI